VVLSCIFLFSVYQIVTIQWGYVKAERLYSAAQETYVTPSSEEENAYSVDITSLRQINRDVIAWLLVDGTDISYPVLHTTDNEKYLKTAYDGTKSNSGSIFMNAYNDADFSDQNTLIYGHHMRDKSMFGHLMDFDDPDYLNEHRYFTIYTDTRTLKYEIFAAYVTYSASFVYTDHFDYTWDFYDYIQKSLTSSVLDMNVDVTTSDKIVTLSTCTSRGIRAERFVVQGKLMTDTETE
jgi:sortase B